MSDDFWGVEMSGEFKMSDDFDTDLATAFQPNLDDDLKQLNSELISGEENGIITLELGDSREEKILKAITPVSDDDMKKIIPTWGSGRYNKRMELNAKIVTTKINELKLNLGCGRKPIHGYINIDIRQEVNPDICMDVTHISNKWYKEVDQILAIHVLEHLPPVRLPWSPKTYKDALKDWFIALKPGGELYISVPDLQAVIDHWNVSNSVMKHKELKTFLHGGFKDQWDIHYTTWDLLALTNALEEVGFENVERYDWRKTDHAHVDSYEQAYLPHMQKETGRLMSLNVKCRKPDGEKVL